MLHLCLRIGLLVAMLSVIPSASWAEPITINFEGLDDFTSVGSLFPGLTFSKATVQVAGISLNEFDFPPASGTNAVIDDGGGIRVDFSADVFSVGGYFTYITPVTLSAYDAGNNLLGTATSLFAENWTSSGVPGASPNELLQLVSSTAISYVTLLGDPLGFSFYLDDFTYDLQAPVDPAPVPEPTSLLLFGTGLAAVLGKQMRIRRRRTCG